MQEPYLSRRINVLENVILFESRNQPLKIDNLMSNQPKKSKRDIRTFEAEDDVAKMLDDAISAGAQLKDLVNEALRIHGPEVLAAKVKELRKKADEIEKRIGGGKR